MARSKISEGKLVKRYFQAASATLCFVSGSSWAAGQSTPMPDPGIRPVAAAAAVTVKLPDDLHQLVGKHVLVGRMPLCVPKSYTANLSYAGKPATVISFIRNVTLDHTNVNRMPPGMRPMMEDLKKGGNLLFRFADGTELDACGSIAFNTLAANVELAPGETITAPTVVATRAGVSQASASGVPDRVQQCPIVITKVSSGVSVGHALVDALTTSELQRQVDQTIHGGQSKHYVDVRVHNAGEKPVVAFEFSAVYSNKMGDKTTSATYVSQNTHPINPGEEYKASAMDRDESSQNGAGEMKLFVSRVRFTDGTIWRDNGSASCARTKI